MPIEFVAATPELSQGDLFAAVPNVYVRSLAYMVKVDKNKYELRPRPPRELDTTKDHQANVREASAIADPEDPFGNALGFRRSAVVLSHDCELDKLSDRPTVLVALVREMRLVHADDQTRIREYDEKRTFFLPQGEYLAEDSFIDFRVITTIRREELENLRRVASLNEDGRVALRAQLFRFFARRALPPEWRDWPEETEAEADVGA